MMPTSKHILERVKQVVIDFSEIPSELQQLTSDEDLFKLGMSSRSSVSLMMGLESEFDIEFPDEMLRKEIFQSVETIGQAIESLSTAKI